MYSVLQTEPKLFTMGTYDTHGIFQPVSDHPSYGEAQEAANRANGIRTPKMIQEERLEKFTMAAMQGYLASWITDRQDANPETVAKRSVEYAQVTLARLDYALRTIL